MRFFTLLLVVSCGIETDLIPEPADDTLSVPPEPDNPVQVDRIVQATEPVVDVLFVVDNSSSMANEQQALQNNFPAFIDYFANSGLDYHIGMVSTDVQRPDHSGKLRVFQDYRFIDNETPNPANIFQGMTSTLGVLSGSEESGRAAAYTALELIVDTPRNEGFLRPEAELHIIFVSDTFDNSSANPVTRNEFLSWAANLKVRPGLVTMHGIVVLPNDGSCPNGRVGTQYVDYATVTGGITASICEQDWSPALDALGLQTSGLKQEFFLSRIPVTDPELMLDVLVTYFDTAAGSEVTRGFEVCTPATETESCEVLYQPGRNSISFLDFTPDPFAEIVVRYFIAENFAAGAVGEDVF